MADSVGRKTQSSFATMDDLDPTRGHTMVSMCVGKQFRSTQSAAHGRRKQANGLGERKRIDNLFPRLNPVVEWLIRGGIGMIRGPAKPAT